MPGGSSRHHRTWALLPVADAFRARLWPLPVLCLVAAVGLGFGLPMVDRATAEEVPPWVSSLAFGGDAAAARGVLAAIGGAFITITSLTFSLTLVTLQLASSQFTPRLLRTFSSDRVVQLTLGLFLGIFAYCLVVLRTVREATSESRPSSDVPETAFVPRISVTFSVVLAMVGVTALVLFLAHLTRQIRVEPVLDDVRAEGLHALRHTGTGGTVPARLQEDRAGEEVMATRTGFVTDIDVDDLVRAATAHDALVDVTASPGSFVLTGMPVARLVPARAATFAEGPGGSDGVDRLRSAVADALSVGQERTATQDPTFALRQLGDIVLRALSPSMNDPTTAIHGLGHLAAIMGEMLERGFGDAVLTDDDGAPRVVVRHVGLDHWLDVAVGQPLVYGSQDPLVVRELLTLLGRLAWTARDDDAVLETVRQWRERVLAGAEELLADSRWGPMVRDAAERVDAAARGRWD